MSKQNVVIVSPDGDMQYCTKIENNNPYCKNNEKMVQTTEKIDEENEGRYRELIQQYDNLILLTNIEIINARKLEKYNFTVRFICILDIFTNIIYLFDIEIFANIIFFIISCFGYVSTYNYNRKGFRLYLIYKYIISIYSISIITCYNIKLFNTDLNIKMLSNSTLSNYNYNYNYNYIYTIYLNDMFYISVCVFQMFICFFLQYYYNLFPKYIMINNI